MNRLLLACVAILGSLALSPPGVQAQTCDPRQNAPDYAAGSPAPIVCDLHGSQNVVLKNAAGATIDNLGTGTAKASAPSLVEGQGTAFSFDLSGNARITPGTYIAGEDPAATGGGSANGVMVTEERYLISATVTSDTQIKGSAGYVKDLNCVGNDAAATAGTIKIEDALTATTPVIFTYTVPAVALTSPVLTFPLGVVVTTGIFLDFTTTADVACYVRYR